MALGSIQCPEISTIARGRRGNVAATDLRKAAIASQASIGFHSMKKHGPAPCGTKSVGIRAGGVLLACSFMAS
ncbi:hypothetical protein MT1_2480 [Pseudomonas sp. MT-1]|nr:hypothetical protein MT1_2480 [Pseudomonas sp. MT-1]